MEIVFQPANLPEILQTMPLRALAASCLLCCRRMPSPPPPVDAQLQGFFLAHRVCRAYAPTGCKCLAQLSLFSLLAPRCTCRIRLACNLPHGPPPPPWAPLLPPACRSEGYTVILVNSNPATIMTDPDTADRTYVGPMTPELVEQILEKVGG